MLNTLQLTRVALKILGKFKGKLGEIAIWESEQTGDRLYREGRDHGWDNDYNDGERRWQGGDDERLEGGRGRY